MAKNSDWVWFGGTRNVFVRCHPNGMFVELNRDGNYDVCADMSGVTLFEGFARMNGYKHSERTAKAAATAALKAIANGAEPPNHCQRR